MELQNLDKTINTLSSEELQKIYTSDFWNDIENEKKKPWWIEDGDYEKLRKFLKESQLYDEYLFSEKIINSYNKNDIVVADLAAGIGWTSALISKLDKVSTIKAFDISIHRIDILCPHAIKALKGVPEKIKRYIGSFYSTKISKESVDIIYLFQAFHHADKPIFLLNESFRILKNGGIVIISGEPYKNSYQIFKRFIKYFLTNKKITFNFRKLFPVHDIYGDHIYKNSEYFSMAKEVGFSCEKFKLPSENMLYLLKKKI
ncbi:class I SAM-dependent methyltransferase [Candidatus Pelagibacter sp.]|nr:class I SAM-dependent methyltransferase [Candidatus Pelagibacter sp.]